MPESFVVKYFHREIEYIAQKPIASLGVDGRGIGVYIYDPLSFSVLRLPGFWHFHLACLANEQGHRSSVTTEVFDRARLDPSDWKAQLLEPLSVEKPQVGTSF